MPVLTNAAMIDRPGKRARASAMPKGIPIESEIKVAPPEILRDSQVIAQTSASKQKTNSIAFCTPCQISSTLNSGHVLFLAGNRNEKRLAEFLNAETANHI